MSIPLELPGRFLPDRWLGSIVLQPEQRVVLAELEGPGCVRRLGMQLAPGAAVDRRILVRIYWDGEAEPSVEAPLGDFFGICHGLPVYPIRSRYLTARPPGGLANRFPMPFGEAARLEIQTGPIPPTPLAFALDWHRYRESPLPEPLRFHARWRREFPCQAFGEDFLVLDAAGRGRLEGLVCGVGLHDASLPWGHAGGDSLYIDGEGEPCYLHGADGALAFGEPEEEGTPEAGLPFSGAIPESSVPYLAGYRFFEEGIPFERTLEYRLGSLANDLCSTAYWYQEEPHREFTRRPPWELMLPGTEIPRGDLDLPDRSGGEWWLCGPFENAEDMAMRGILPVERALDRYATYDGGFLEDSPWTDPLGPEEQRTARWVRRRQSHGFLDFGHFFRPRASGVARAWPAAAMATCSFHLRANSKATFRIAWDDELTLRVNDVRVLNRERHSSFRSQDVMVSLRAGANHVMLKLSNSQGSTWGGWCFAFRALLPDGTVLTPAARF